MAEINILTVVEPGFEVLTPDGWVSGMIALIENAGRRCYKSEHKIEPGSADKFVSKFCRDMGHTSMMEHAFATVVWTGSRAMSHQLVRHRIAAYSQESQRYCDYGKKGFTIIVPPALGIEPGTWYRDQLKPGWRRDDGKTMYARSVSTIERMQVRWLDESREVYMHYCWWMKFLRLRPEDARFKLPNETKTEVAATYNFHTWRHIFEHRGLNARAQWEIRGIAQAVCLKFAELWPAVFKDLGERVAEVRALVKPKDVGYNLAVKTNAQDVFSGLLPTLD
ncbi:hypothetical protein LCGC14_1405190 [marine sediment metagenome]|uniref:Uncharacterized protein n=1 Tax=marine sediment metagenome TaxID=412755 RepID=A0A0F9JW85_9ZZZZ